MSMIIDDLSEFLLYMTVASPRDAGRDLCQQHASSPRLIFITDAGDVPYTYDAALEPIRDCVGFRVETVVNGSDKVIPPCRMTFPFESGEFVKEMKRLDRATTKEWIRVNKGKKR